MIKLNYKWMCRPKVCHRFFFIDTKYGIYICLIGTTEFQFANLLCTAPYLNKQLKSISLNCKNVTNNVNTRTKIGLQEIEGQIWENLKSWGIKMKLVPLTFIRFTNLTFSFTSILNLHSPSYFLNHANVVYY